MYTLESLTGAVPCTLYTLRPVHTGHSGSSHRSRALLAVHTVYTLDKLQPVHTGHSGISHRGCALHTVHTPAGTHRTLWILSQGLCLALCTHCVHTGHAPACTHQTLWIFSQEPCLAPLYTLSRPSLNLVIFCHVPRQLWHFSLALAGPLLVPEH